jgi:hypothetical protein
MSRKPPARPDGSSGLSPGGITRGSFRYDSRLDHQSIRLLEFENTSSKPNVVRCRLVTTRLADAQYVALSTSLCLTPGEILRLPEESSAMGSCCMLRRTYMAR